MTESDQGGPGDSQHDTGAQQESQDRFSGVGYISEQHEEDVTRISDRIRHIQEEADVGAFTGKGNQSFEDRIMDSDVRQVNPETDKDHKGKLSHAVIEPPNGKGQKEKSGQAGEQGKAEGVVVVVHKDSQAADDEDAQGNEEFGLGE